MKTITQFVLYFTTAQAEAGYVMTIGEVGTVRDQSLGGIPLTPGTYVMENGRLCRAQPSREEPFGSVARVSAQAVS